MGRPRASTSRLLLVPTLLILGLLAMLHVVRGAVPDPADPALVVDELPPVAGEPTRCTRSDDPDKIADIRGEFYPTGRVSSAMVLACPAAYDGQDVFYVGELVGDLLHRDGGAWVMVNDDGYALEVGPLGTHGEHRGTNSGLTVWIADELLTEVTGLGRPQQRGDVVGVLGRIRRTDPDDGGGLTLRAHTLTVLAPAATVTDPVDLPQALLAMGAVGAGAALWAARRRADREQMAR